MLKQLVDFIPQFNSKYGITVEEGEKIVRDHYKIIIDEMETLKHYRIYLEELGTITVTRKKYINYKYKLESILDKLINRPEVFKNKTIWNSSKIEEIKEYIKRIDINIEKINEERRIKADRKKNKVGNIQSS